MGRDKDEPKKVKATIGETDRKKQDEILQEKIKKLVDFFYMQDSDLKNLGANLEAKRIAILTYALSEYIQIFRPYSLIINKDKYKREYRALFDLKSKTIPPDFFDETSIKEVINPVINQAKRIFLDFSDDSLISIFSDLLSPQWDGPKGLLDIEIFLGLILFYHLHLEKIAPKAVVYQMSTVMMILIHDALVAIRLMDSKGKTSDRITKGTEIKKAKKEQRAKRIIDQWTLFKKKKGTEAISLMTRNKIATVIQSKNYYFSVNTIIQALEQHFKSLNHSPPWKPVIKKFIKT